MTTEEFTHQLRNILGPGFGIINHCRTYSLGDIKVTVYLGDNHSPFFDVTSDGEVIPFDTPEEVLNWLAAIKRIEPPDSRRRELNRLTRAIHSLASASRKSGFKLSDFKNLVTKINRGEHERKGSEHEP